MQTHSMKRHAEKEKKRKGRRRSTATVATKRAHMFNSLLTEKMGEEGQCAVKLAESIAWCGGDASKLAFSSSFVLVGTPLRSLDLASLLKTVKTDTVPIAYQQWHTVDSKIFETNYYGDLDITNLERHHLGDSHLCDLLLRVPQFGQNRLQNIPNVSRGQQAYMCFDKRSFIMAPVNSRTDVETIQWRREGIKTLPSYLYLCKLELDEICEKFGIVSKNFKMLLYSVVILGFGHLLTEVGRRAYYIVLWKYARFILLCFGYWTDEVVAL